MVSQGSERKEAGEKRAAIKHTHRDSREDDPFHTDPVASKGKVIGETIREAKRTEEEHGRKHVSYTSAGRNHCTGDARSAFSARRRVVSQRAN